LILKQTRPSITSLVTSKRVSSRTSCSNIFARPTCCKHPADNPHQLLRWAYLHQDIH